MIKFNCLTNDQNAPVGDCLYTKILNTIRMIEGGNNRLLTKTKMQIDSFLSSFCYLILPMLQSCDELCDISSEQSHCRAAAYIICIALNVSWTKQYCPSAIDWFLRVFNPLAWWCSVPIVQSTVAKRVRARLLADLTILCVFKPISYFSLLDFNFIAF